MARVVQRRSNPPYLLILFVFLFLIATVVAVLMYLKNDEMTLQLKAVNQQLDDTGTRKERDDTTAQLKSQSIAPKGKTLIGFHVDEVAKLKEIIVFDNQVNAAAARSQFDRLVTADSRAKDGLIHFIGVLKEELKAKDTEIDQLNKKLQFAESDATAARSTLDGIKDMIATFTTENARRAEAIRQEVAKLSSADQAKWQSIEELMEQQQAAARQQGDRTKAELTKLGQQNVNLQKQLAEFVDAKRRDSQKVDVSSMANQPAGKILRVLNDTVYINIGRKDKIQPAMTFAIFPAGPVTDEKKLKGTLEVLQVGETTSECRITNRYDTAGPVLTGDIIGNVAYSTRTYYFVVKGHFDMTGSGKKTSEGAAVIKDLIARSGGKLMDDVNIATDFLIMGDCPPVPTKPSEDASDIEVEIYTQQMRVIQDYEKARKEAEKFFIPVLNDNRFLALIGYQPGKTELPKLLVQGD